MFLYKVNRGTMVQNRRCVLSSPGKKVPRLLGQELKDHFCIFYWNGTLDSCPLAWSTLDV